MEEQAWHSAFFDGLTIMQNTPVVLAGVGHDNHVGNVNVIGEQTAEPSHGINLGIAVPVLVAGVGTDNHVDGDVTSITQQHAGDHGSHSSVPFIGDIDIAVTTSTLLAGVGVGNDVHGGVTSFIGQDI